jgi:LCP family protein required for cell wall assembly
MSDEREPSPGSSSKPGGTSGPDREGTPPATSDTDTARPKRRSFVRRHWVLTSLAVVLLLVVGTAGGYLYWARQQVAEIPTFALERPEDPVVQPSVDEEGREDLNVLLLGADHGAEGESVAEDLEDGEWTPGVHLSDTLILLHIPKDRKSASMMSIPRDSWVKIPGYEMNNGRAKINAAFSEGGPSMAVQAVELLTKVPIDHVAIIDWKGFRDLTSALGGVRVYIPETVYDVKQDVTWEEGWVDLEGDLALKYVRTRYGLDGGDLDRIQRQQNFMRALMKELLSSSTTHNPLKFSKVLSSLAGYLTIDDDWDTDELIDLAWQMRNVRSNDVEFFTAPFGSFATKPYPGLPEGQSVVLLDKPQMRALVDAMMDDDTDRYLADYPDERLPDDTSID